jgi:ketosteroid isomerase-like protein
LYEKQFTRVWPNISEFRIVPASISIQISGDLAWATCLFESSSAASESKAMQRKGRITFIFSRRDKKWVMVHSHDSLYPAPPE